MGRVGLVSRLFLSRHERTFLTKYREKECVLYTGVSFCKAYVSVTACLVVTYRLVPLMSVFLVSKRPSLKFQKEARRMQAFPDPSRPCRI